MATQARHRIGPKVPGDRCGGKQAQRCNSGLWTISAQPQEAQAEEVECAWSSKGGGTIITPLGLSAEQTSQVLGAACRAPSLHNSQPWAFRLTPNSIELHLDHGRTLPFTDPTNREARLACGAALFNLRLALAKYGVRGRITIGTDPQSGPLAVIEHGGDFVLSPERAELERAITHRHTNRQPFFDAEVPVGYQHLLARSAEAERATLQMIIDPGRLAHLRQWAATAHRELLADPGWTAEFTKWTGRTGSPDGVPISAAGPAPAAQDIWTLRDFGRPDRPDRLEGRDFEEHPLIAVLGTFNDRPQAQVQAGEAMQRVLLTATKLGLAASFLSQLIEVESAQSLVKNLLGGQIFPQAVLRIGFGGPVPATPRRPVADCLLAEPLVQR